MPNNSPNSMKRISLISIALVLVGWLSLGPATAFASGAHGADYDEPATNLLDDLLNSLLTVPFDLLEVDVSTLGVSDSDPEIMNSGTSGYDSPDPGEDNDDESCHDSRMRIVDDDRRDCPNAQYTHIQDAIDDANPGDKIKVCRGTYEEQVLITKDNLNVFSVPHWGATIQAPPTMTVVTYGKPIILGGNQGEDNGRSIVTVRQAHDVLIRHFTISGPSTNIFAGVRVMGNGSATIRHNHITQIQGSADKGEGHGVNVGRFREGQVGSACVRHNLIDNYQKTGIFVDNVGTFANVRHNEIIGSGARKDVPQNGIQISRNARAEVRHNRVSRNDFEACGCAADFDAIGILTQDENSNNCAGRCNNIGTEDHNLLNVHHNKTFQNQVGVGLGMATIRGQFDHNHSYCNLRVGLRAYGMTRNGGTTAPESERNTISYNKMENNKLDCSDQTSGNGTATRANYWIKDKGATEDAPPGICKK